MATLASGSNSTSRSSLTVFSSQPLAAIKMAKIDKLRQLNEEGKMEKGCQEVRKEGNPGIQDTELNLLAVTLIPYLPSYPLS